jgi:hypothetical protein
MCRSASKSVAAERAVGDEQGDREVGGHESDARRRNFQVGSQLLPVGMEAVMRVISLMEVQDDSIRIIGSIEVKTVATLGG